MLILIKNHLPEESACFLDGFLVSQTCTKWDPASKGKNMCCLQDLLLKILLGKIFELVLGEDSSEI